MTTEKIKNTILSRFDNAIAKSSEIIDYVLSLDSSVPPATVTWVLYDLVKKNEAVRLGRGVYSFQPKPIWKPVLSQKAKEIVDIIKEEMPYLKVTITDSSILNEFMVQQPFSYSIVIEVPSCLVENVVQKLNREELDVFSWKNRKLAGLYNQTDTTVYVTKQLKTPAVLSYAGNIIISSLEKTLVDLLAEPELYGQSQSEELNQIYKNASERYALDYSQMLKYATNRGKRKEAETLLLSSTTYQKYLEARNDS